MSNRILTEEELNTYAVYVPATVINSHRELLKANAGLSYENMKYKQFLKNLQSTFYIAGDYNNLDKVNTFMEDAK